MKKFLLILTLIISSASIVVAQDNDVPEQNATLQERMKEYMQRRLDLTKPEADKFYPVFLRYLNERRNAIKEFPGDALKRKQRVVEIQLKYREQFRQTIADKAERVEPDRVDRTTREFTEIIKNEVKNRREERRQNIPNKNDRQ